MDHVKFLQSKIQMLLDEAFGLIVIYYPLLLGSHDFGFEYVL